MDKFLIYLGGLLGGYGLIHTPISGTFLSSLEPVLDVIGVLSMVVFSAGFVVRGILSMLGK